MAAVSIVLHPRRASDLAREAVDWLVDRGHEVRLLEEDAKAAGLTEWSWKEDEVMTGLDLVLSLGGDGTMLRAVKLACDTQVPVLGVNVGHLGFLAEVEPVHLTEVLERFFAGDYLIEHRMTLAVEVSEHHSTGAPYVALNEAVLEKTAPGRTVRLAVAINGRALFSCAADGMIVATPTGSTAYNLSARGPIVSPCHRALLLTPVAPHMLFDRSLVLDATESVRIEVLDGPPAVLSVDGQERSRLAPGDAVTCTSGVHSAQLVTFGRRDFHQILKTKFRLADRW